MNSPVIVLGPGFVGSNAIVKYLRDPAPLGLGYFMGSKWCYPMDKEQHPYDTWEDAEWFKLTENIDDPYLRLNIKKLTTSREAGERHWGFKCPNFWLYLSIFLPVIRDNLNYPEGLRVIAGDRDKDQLIKRMTERWEFSRNRAEARINMYYAIVHKLSNLIPVFWVDQQRLLHCQQTVEADIKEFLDDSTGNDQGTEEDRES